MEIILRNTLRFFVFALFQVVVLNNLELGWGLFPMLYPLFILLLPFEMKTIPLMVISFVFGMTIDTFSNTYGLHASAAVVFAFFRPIIFRLFEPRDGYEKTEASSIYARGSSWFFYVFGLLLIIHHTWFFAMEIFKFNEVLLLLRKIALSVPASFLLCVLVQLIFVSKKSVER